MAALLQCRGVSKQYGGLAAVSDLSFALEVGEVFGIAGPNGAGKTTLFDVISGHTRITRGEIWFDGQRVDHLKSYDICRLGIARTFQIPVVFQSQSALMNAVVGAHFGRAGSTGHSLLRFDAETVAGAREALEFVGLGGLLDAPSTTLSLFDKKRLMLASALAMKPRLLMLDEPVGGLNPTEIDRLMGLIQQIRQTGMTIVIIEHVMRALMGLSDRVMIMHYGKRLFVGIPEEARQDPEVLRVYLGAGGSPVPVSK